MDWDKAIARNRTALEAIAATLFALLGFAGTAREARIPRTLHGQVLRLLVPAESALRRLIAIVAHGMVAKPSPARPMPQGLVLPRQKSGRMPFRLFDPRKRLVTGRRIPSGPRLEPRIRSFGMIGDPRVPLFRPQASAPAPVPLSAPDGLVGVSGLYRRFAAFQAALANVPGQAQRLARLRARRQRLTPSKPSSPLRPGRPPGSRRQPTHAVDLILAECHSLALDRLAANTS
jgi:hypothetical protein